ncbi:O-antigen ligase family protein [Neorhizobium galegae]|nr:O-antigen ligase family protein [Neorhizobium galegae]
MLLLITLTPFVDTSLNPALAKPALWSQLLAYVLFLIVVVYAMTPRVRSVIFQPRLLLAFVFGWLFLTAALSVDPLGAVRRVLIALTVCISASAFLMLPKGESQFARLAGGGVMLIVGLCYFGVLFLPRLAVHQLTDFLEPQHAGLWKGIYVQKNETGVVMALSCFVGIYLMSAWSRVIGLLVIAASCLFLLKTGAKTSTAMLPGIFVLSIFFERWRWIRIPVVFGGVGLLNLATVGVSTIAPLREIVAATGIDTTYTARADIWRLALDAIAQQPITGYGFGSFWGAESLVNSDMRTLNWAVRAVDAHNAYVDAAMNAGIPGLILMVIWVLATPLKNLAAIDAAKISRRSRGFS